MDRRPWCRVAWCVSFSTVMFVLVTCASVAHAKTWAKWAPAPLASDSAYAALAVKPADSLTAGQLAWLGVQREWRRERDEEAMFSTSRDVDAGRLHGVRKSDERFAALAAQPYASLTAGDLAWLISDSAARRQDRHDSGRTAAAVIIAVSLGALVTLVLIGAAFGEAFGD